LDLPAQHLCCLHSLGAFSLVTRCSKRIEFGR